MVGAGAVSSTAFRARPTKLLIVVLENHAATDATAGLPRLAALAKRYGLATRSYAVAHPSLPNYLALAGGSTFGIRDDADPLAHPLTGSSIFGQALVAGTTATTYAEGMTTRCQTTSSGRYAVRHNPWTYFVDERAACRRHDRPSGTPSRGALHGDIVRGTLPTVGLLVPDLCNDAHDCALSTTDRWLGRWLDAVRAGADFRSGRLAVVVTFDEDDHSAGNRILTVVLHPSLHGRVVRTRLDHRALARAASDLARRPGLRSAGSAPDLLTAFGL